MELIIVLLVLILVTNIIAIAIPKKDSNTRMSYEEVMSALMFLINLELTTYETDIFSKKNGLKNKDYENYLSKISNRINENISDDFKKEALYYMTEAAIYRQIIASVKLYLNQKIIDSTF